MRILLLAPQPFLQDRGTPMAVDLVLRGLSARGDHVDVVTYHEGRDVEYPNVSLHRIRAPRWLRNIQPGFSFRKILCDVLLFFQAWRLLARNRYDLIHAVEEAAFLATFFRACYAVPFVYDMDSSMAQQLVEKAGYLRPLAWLFNWCERFVIRQSAVVAPVCPALAELARVQGARKIAPLNDISQLRDGDFHDVPSLRQKLQIDGIVGMYVGNLEPYQGIDLLLDSLRVARQQGAKVELVVAGGQPADIAKYRDKSQALRIAQQVHFIGPWPAHELGRLLSQADFLVTPRIKGINTPMKIFAYLHSGRSVLATDLPTHTQVLDNSVALLAPPEPEPFAASMLRLANDDQLRKQLGAAGKSFVEANYTYPQYQTRLNHLYDLVQSCCALPKCSFQSAP